MLISVWLKIDSDICLALRHALDRLGGRYIQIDYPLVIPYGLLLKEYKTIPIVHQLENLPFMNLWLHVSNFGMSAATPAGLNNYIKSAWQFRSLGKPVVADGVAGLVSTSLIAFGAAGGVCHGIAEKTDFRTNHWKKPSNGGGGNRPRIYLPQIDLYLFKNEVEILLKGKGAKRLLACNESCCLNGVKDMYGQHKAHAFSQSIKLVNQLNKVPESRWIDVLMSKNIEPVGRELRKIEKMKLSEPKLMEKIKKQSHRLDLMYQTLDNLINETDVIPVSMKPIIRHINLSDYGSIG